MRILFIPLLLIFTSCVIVTTSVQNVQVEGLPHKSPVRIAEDAVAGRTILRPYILLGQTDYMEFNTGTHSTVDSTGIYRLIPVEGEDYFLLPDGVNYYSFTGKNLHWQIPSFTAGLELEIFMEQFALMFGVNTASVKGSRYWSGNFGAGWSSRYTHWAWRTDFNLRFSRISYNIDFIETSEIFWLDSQERIIRFYSEHGKKTHWGSEFSLTLNSNMKEWPVNIWTCLGFGSQLLYNVQDITPSFGSLSYKDEYSFIAGGISKTLSDISRVIIGVRLNHHPDQKSSNQYPELILQYEVLSDR